jgi:hypothetical protein
MRFACSLEEVPWEHWRMNTTKLDYIGFRFGLFHEGHRARADVDMLLAPLARTTPEGEEGILSLLLAPARDPRLWELPAAGPRVDPPPSRNRRTSSINAWPGNPDRRPPAARDAGQAHVSSRRHTPRTPDALEAPAPTAFRARSNP